MDTDTEKRLRIVFMGSSSASAVCLHALLREPLLEVVGVVTQPDRPSGRGKELRPCKLAEYAAASGVAEVVKTENVNADEPMARIRAWNPDVIAVVAFGQILKKPLLELPPHGCVNCHFSLLPKYRGAAPVIAALAAGDRKTGVTVMHMGVGLDDGPIMLQSYEPIYPDTTGGALMNDLALAGGVTLAKALVLMLRNELPPEIPQDPQYATYVKKLRKTDGLIDWTAPALEIERKIRAYSPWPGSYTFLPVRLRGKRGATGRVGVLKASVFTKLEPAWREAAPGTVLKTIVSLPKGEDGPRGPVVRCGDTALILTELKPDGSAAMDGGAFLMGRPLAAGEDVLLNA